MTAGTTLAERVARNIVANHGEHVLRALVAHFKISRHNYDIAEELGVSRERVRQWRSQLGFTISGWTPDPYLVEVAMGKKNLPSPIQWRRKSRAKEKKG